MRSLAALLVGAACSAGLLPAGAAAAPPAPFGHPCTPQNGVLFCPTASDSQRVPSFDGVPLDVDVTLPPTGDGPFPTIVMLHGWGGEKSSFETTTAEGRTSTDRHYNNIYFAQQGYAVVTPSARGFGRSCGSVDSRTAPGCDRGWIHLADQRFEARDTQHLLGLLVDQGVAKPGALGVTGISYGGIQSHILARLRDRIRRADGSYAPWRSPNGRSLSIAAAWPRWGGTDLTYSLYPNGRFKDFGRFGGARQSRSPAGVMKRSFVTGLYALSTISGFVPPQGADPMADITSWVAITDAGEPYRANAIAAARELSRFHSSVGLSGTPAPLLVQNGWSDDLLPVVEALRAYRGYEDLRGARVSLQLGDLGHSRASNKGNSDRFFNAQGAAFFGAYLKGQGSPPRHRSVTAFTQTCPLPTPGGGPFRARSWERLRPRRIRFGAFRRQRITWNGGNLETARAFDAPAGGDACKTVRAERARGTAVGEARFARTATMLGLPTVRARIHTRGRGGMIAARLWDVHGGRQTLISRGVLRLRDNQRGRIVFQLFGGGWRFAKGHVAKLELLGRDPNFLRPSNFRFSVRVTNLTVNLPTR